VVELRKKAEERGGMGIQNLSSMTAGHRRYREGLSVQGKEGRGKSVTIKIGGRYLCEGVMGGQKRGGGGRSGTAIGGVEG